MATPEEGRQRVWIGAVHPELAGGRYPIKRTVGDRVVVTAAICADGHDLVVCRLCHRHEDDAEWSEVPMVQVDADRWQAEFTTARLGRHMYTLTAWVDPFLSWQRDLARRVEAGQDVAVELQVGAEMLAAASRRADPPARQRLAAAAAELRAPVALDPELGQLMTRHADRQFATRYPRELAVVVDRELARYGAWYELFPRSCSPAPGRHGTLRDCAERLLAVAAMGFDVVYLPPIHPIGETNRKGRRGTLRAGPEDVGSPWAIGSAAGGHTAIHPALGTLADFADFLARARDCGLKVAMDLAFQCSPDHPYVREHPEWFRHRPDGSIRYAENPPKQYQDIYAFDFACAEWQALWAELLQVTLFWADRGVRIFRVDNPHTKPFVFWEWLIGKVKSRYPETIFLAEAFTRPRVMYHLARLGFTQSYTYFAWRNTSHELREYLTELTQTEVREYFRPNFWPNTPDILTEYLQHGGRPAFVVRLVLAATLSASYGIYGPAFELCEHRPLAPGQEEYMDAEKYELRQWNVDRPDSLAPVVERVNSIRRQNPALQQNEDLQFHPVDNDRLLVYTRRTPDLTNVLLVVVNLDPHHTQSGWVEVPVEALGVSGAAPYQVHDLLSGDRYLWQGARNYVELRPHVMPAHILLVRRQVRGEGDFAYYE